MKKRKKIFLSVFLIPLATAFVVGLNWPQYYRAECEITELPMSAPDVVSQVGNIDEAKKVKIFSDRAEATKRVSLSFAKKSADKIDIVVEAKTESIAKHALEDLFHHIKTLPEIKGTIEKMLAAEALKRERFLEEGDIQIKALTDAKKENLIFLEQVKAMIKDKRLSILSYNPADLIRKDADLSLEINRLRQAKRDSTIKQAINVKPGILGPPSITEHPSNTQIRRMVVFSGLVGLFAALVIVFLLEYADKINVARNQRTT